MKNETNFIQTGFGEQRISNQVENESLTIPVIEEVLHVGKKVIEAGKVNILKTVSEHTEIVNLPLMHEEVNVEHVPINQYVEIVPNAVRYEGDTMIIPVLREVVVIEKRLLLVEELRVTKRQIHTEEIQQVLLRKEEINIQRLTENINNNIK